MLGPRVFEIRRLFASTVRVGKLTIELDEFPCDNITAELKSQPAICLGHGTSQPSIGEQSDDLLGNRIGILSLAVQAVLVLSHIGQSKPYACRHNRGSSCDSFRYYHRHTLGKQCGKNEDPRTRVP